MPDQPKHDNSPADTPLGKGLALLRNLWRRLENVVFGLVLLLILLYFILQMPVVQNWLIGKVTGYLATELKTRVEIRHIDIEFFDKLVLEGFYLEDLKGDTLLYAGTLSAGLDPNIFSVFSNRLEFNEISLKNARINIRRGAGEYDSNLKFLLDYFATPKSDGPSKPFSVKIKAKNIYLDDVDFIQDDRVKGKMMHYRVPTASIRVNKMDMVEKVIDIQSITLKGLFFDMEDYPSQPLPLRPEDTPAKTVPSGTVDTTDPMRFLIGQFSLTDGHFEMDRFHISPSKQTAAEVMDFNHLFVENIGFQADNVKFDSRLVFEGVLKHFAAKEQCGFEITHGEAGRVVVSDTLTALYNVKIQTPGSSIGDTIMLHYDTYRDYRKFNSSVDLDLRLSKGSKIKLGDLISFSGPLARNRFFSTNQEEVAQFSGRIYGKVAKKLRADDLVVQLGSQTYMEGSFRGDGLTGDIDQSIIEFQFDRLQSDLRTIGKIIPGFSPPAAFYTLGNIAFSGDYQIFFGFSHILHGKIRTDVGNGDVDLNLDMKNGRERATYSGYLNMRDFDLATWTNNSDFGRTTFNIRIADGSSGLTLPTIKAKLEGSIDSFSYRGYSYRNVVMNGTFRELIFDGKLGVKDPNIDFTFDGTLNLKDTIPQFSFVTDIRRLDMAALNLTDKDWVISGKVDRIQINARNWQDITGTAILRNFQIIQDKQFTHYIDSLQFESYFRPDGTRYMSLNSDVGEGLLEGTFDFQTVFRNLAQIFSRYHPEFAARLNLPAADSAQLTDNYSLHLNIRNTRGLTKLISSDLDTLRNISINGAVNARQGTSSLRISAPYLRYNGFALSGTELLWEGAGEDAMLHLSIPNSVVSKTILPPILLDGFLTSNELHFKLTARDTNRIVKGVNFDGVLSTVDSLWQIKFNASEIALFNDNWAMNEENYIRFAKNYLVTKDFELFNGDQRILLDSFNLGKGLSLSLTNFDLNFLNRFVNPKKINYRGKIYDFDVKISDVFNMRGINTYLTTDTVFINNVPYGDVTGNFEMAHLSAPLWYKAFLNYDDRQLRVAGAWIPPKGSPELVEEAEMTIHPGEFAAQVNARNFPLAVLETFVPGISGTNGQFNVDAKVFGPFNKIGMSGKAKIVTGQFQLDYLKAKYNIVNQNILLTSTKIWADKDTIWDNSTPRNMAVIKGGLTHKYFKEWRLDTCEVSSESENFVILNTTAKDNATYYGKGAGKFKAQFSGTFSKTNILIDATAGKDTRLYLPITSVSDAQEVKFIKFKTKNARDTLLRNTKSSTITELKGLNFEMNVSLTDAAEVQLIFDEQAGDIIRGRGVGDIKLTINREGEFKMYGNYAIRRGEYMFTLLNWVNKPFTVTEGGTISWYGDPYGAQISLDATYEENTPVYNLIRDELQLVGGDDSDAAKAAKRPTKTVVTMHLKGNLMTPNISFSVDFPNISNDLKSLTDNKLRLLRQDPSELNRQVFGLVVVGSFLPSNGGFIQSSDYVTSAFNTLTQVLSNQFSNYLTGLASEWFGTSVSSIDFNIAYDEYQNSLTNTPDNPITGRELQIRLTSGFANDRVTVQVGSQFGLGRPSAAVQNGFLGEDVTVEIQLTQNRQWRLKVYQRTEPDITGGQRRARYGFGLTFRKEFDSFDEMVAGIRGWFSKKG
ncbi:MAG TPA: translocation/assembly module TamB domain-containing protein [Saprospiraceae bacterium]|nr:translocation/assembly module TamB domain-containing protein [Saprospiraceae bacterium]HPI06063.1 translocation/assembly module TamB domain-containing protein [Saprospiraceae bacterium]